MSILSVLVPAYTPRAYAGATPTPYQSGVVDKFERQLAALSPHVVRHHNSTRLLPDVSGRFAHQEILTRYDVLVDPEEKTMGEVIELTLKSFNLENVTALYRGDAQPLTVEDAVTMLDGLHDWNV